MAIRRLRLVLSLLGVAVVLLVLSIYWRRGQSQSDDISELKARIPREMELAAAAVEVYSPKNGLVFDELPNVIKVEPMVRVDKPTHRIIHIRDWHYVPRNLFALEVPEREFERRFEEHLLLVELCHIDQAALLRCLIKHHGLKAILSEGLSPERMDSFHERIKLIKTLEPLHRQKWEIQSLKSAEARNIEKEIDDMLAKHREDFLEAGAAGRLLASGELQAILPLEDQLALEEAKPITVAGAVRSDRQKIKVRRDAMVRRALQTSGVAVLILGGSHDLSESVRAQSRPCEYVRITTKNYPSD